MTQEIGFLTFPGIEELDLVGPWEIFSLAQSPDGLPAFHLTLLGEAPVHGRGGFPFHPSLPLDQWQGEVLVIPGGPGARQAAAAGAPWLSALRQAADRASWVLSVCTGAFLTAAAGLVDPERHMLTTHRDFLDELKGRYPAMPVVRQRVAVSPGLVSTAGVSAGVDGALALL